MPIIGYDLPLYAVWRIAPDRWLMWAPDPDPLMPAVRVVTVLGDSPLGRGAVVVPFDPNARKPSAEPAKSTFEWRAELHQLADLLNRMAPDYQNPERFYLQRSALVRELRRLAYRAGRRPGP
jgi:hypothetical protein